MSITLITQTHETTTEVESQSCILTYIHVAEDNVFCECEITPSCLTR